MGEVRAAAGFEGGTGRGRAGRKHPRARVLVVDDESYVRDSLLALLVERGFDGVGVASVNDALALLAGEPVDVVLSDFRMPGADGLELVRRMRVSAPETPIVILTGHPQVPAAVECLKAGASDYIVKPAGPDVLDLVLRRVLETRALRREVGYLRRAAAPSPGTPIGESPRWRRVMAQVEAAAPTDATVLLLGESGTGKELLAWHLHERSRRAAGPFIRVNCAAVPMEVWESEFFGHRKGSFTGATSDRDGRFLLADGGTLLLDEIGAMPLAGQAKLLRALQDGEFDRVGDREPTRVDVRVIASTNSDLAAEVEAGTFRADLYYRLNVIRIDVPPLRERSDDVALLAAFFVRDIATRLGRPIPALDPNTLARLHLYSWPGNVRELRSVIERALILDPVNGLDLLEVGPPLPSSEDAAGSEPGLLNLRAAVNRLERGLLMEADRRSGGVRKEAARLLGIDPRNLAYYARKHGLAAADDERS